MSETNAMEKYYSCIRVITRRIITKSREKAKKSAGIFDKRGREWYPTKELFSNFYIYMATLYGPTSQDISREHAAGIAARGNEDRAGNAGMNVEAFRALLLATSH